MNESSKDATKYYEIKFVNFALSSMNESSKDATKYYKIKFVNLLKKSSYRIKIEKNVAVKCPFILAMIHAGMKETTQLINNKIIIIKFETTVTAIKEYFNWLTGIVKSPNNLDTLLLANYFGDERFIRDFVYPSITIFYKNYGTRLNELNDEILHHYVELYLNNCFNNGDPFINQIMFINQMIIFIKTCPLLAEFIWLNCPREELLKAINGVKKLINLTYAELGEFVLDQYLKYNPKDYHKKYLDIYVDTETPSNITEELINNL